MDNFVLGFYTVGDIKWILPPLNSDWGKYLQGSKSWLTNIWRGGSLSFIRQFTAATTTRLFKSLRILLFLYERRHNFTNHKLQLNFQHHYNVLPHFNSFTVASMVSTFDRWAKFWLPLLIQLRGSSQKTCIATTSVPPKWHVLFSKTSFQKSRNCDPPPPR